MPLVRFELDIDAFARADRAEALLWAVHTSVVIADGAMGTILQQHDLSIDTYFHAPSGATNFSTSPAPTS